MKRQRLQKKSSFKNVGKRDPQRHLKEFVQELMADNVDLALGIALDTVAF